VFTSVKLIDALNATATNTNIKLSFVTF